MDTLTEEAVMGLGGLTATERPADDNVSRRDFLRVGGLSVLGLSASERLARQQALAAAAGKGKGLRRCIFVLMTGGASHLETFDPKPNAPAEFRGPFKAISTAISGVQFSETLPLLAQRADRLTVLRSLSHNAAPIHETGQQLIQTGRLARGGTHPPSLGSLVARLLGPRNNLPAYAVLPRPLGHTGVSMWQGQEAGVLGSDYDPWNVSLDSTGVSEDITPEMSGARNASGEPEHVRRLYGDTEFGQSCLMARRLVERGVRFVTVNMFDRLDNRVTWDCHANDHWSPGGLYDYRDTICPDFDRGLSALLDDLAQRGLLQETLVVAVGEFGRTPRVNDRGGRDHWPGVWSAVLAGGGIPGGTVVGASDFHGSIPADRPVHPAELAATILHSLGLDSTSQLSLAEDRQLTLADGEPIRELVG